MIDFRYHLVSLISVFLALAVGIILGAGPLRGTLGAQLQNQVDQLRTERNELRTDLGAANTAADNAESYIAAAGPQLIEGTLAGRRVAIVDLDAEGGVRDSEVTEQIEAAGASVVAHVGLGEPWTATSAERDRKTVAGGLVDLLPATTVEMSAEQRLASALVVALTQQSETVPGTLSVNAQQLGDQLTQFKLTRVIVEQTVPAEMIVLLVGDSASVETVDGGDAPGEPDSQAIAIQQQLAGAAHDGAIVTVVAGPTARSGDLISAIRSDARMKTQIATVSGIDRASGTISVPLALMASMGGQVGHYGFEDSATAIIPVKPVPATVGEG